MAGKALPPIPPQYAEDYDGWRLYNGTDTILPATFPLNDISYVLELKDTVAPVTDINLIGSNGVVVDNNIARVYGVPAGTSTEQLIGKSGSDPTVGGLLHLDNPNGVFACQYLGVCGTGYLITVQDKSNGYVTVSRYTLIVFGDVDLDGKVTSADVQLCTQKMSSLTPPDVNDANLALSYLSSGPIVKTPDSTILGHIRTQAAGGNPIRYSEYADPMWVKIDNICKVESGRNFRVCPYEDSRKNLEFYQKTQP
jgi:hypothetical protein